MSSTRVLSSQMKADKDKSQSNRVAAIMNTDLQTIPIESNIRQVAKKMSEFRVSSIFLTDNTEEKEILGIITQTDLTRKISASDQLSTKINAKTIMSPLIAVDKNVSIGDAVQIMIKKGIHHLAVKADNDKIVGIVSTTDLAKYLKRKLSKYRYRDRELGEELNIAEALSISEPLPYKERNSDEQC